MGALLGWFAGLAGRLSVTLLLSALKKINPSMLFPKSRYKIRLSKKLARMPFLFADMSLNVRDDYVALDVLSAAPGKPVPTAAPSKIFEKAADKFGSYPRALIFGGGGYGKTTLFRNLALRSLDLWPWQTLFGLRGVLPLYVPLKIVKTSAEFPVLEAMLGSDPYFSGRLGRWRFIRHARRGKLLVLLDGYDEMAYTGGFGHIAKELEHIFDSRIIYGLGGQLARKSVFEQSTYAGLYEALRGARVYMASRYEFFEYNPLDIANDVQKWVVRGLEDRRIELVEKIFGRYRQASKSSTGVDLNAELFLQELTRVGDNNVLDLSRNPLFLTVMCYVYVRERGESNVFRSNSGDLARRCIRLLLEELDRQKSADQTATQQMAIMGRRSDFVEEKYEFLCFFAVELYENERGFFDEEYANESASRYFGGVSASERAEQIRRGLNSTDPTANLVKQIVLSGLLVLVDKRDGISYFDFPHRKFRETLAVDYFSSRRDELLLRAAERQYSELILAFVEQRGIRDDLVNRLIELVIVRASAHVSGLLVDVMRRISPGDAGDMVAKLLHATSESNGVRLPVGIIEFVKPTDENWRLSRVGLASALKLDDEVDIERWAHIGAKVNLGASREIIESSSCSLSFGSLRALVHSPLVSAGSTSMIRKFLFSALAADRLDEAFADLIDMFYLGRSRAERTEFVHRLREVVAGAKLPLSAPFDSFLHSENEFPSMEEIMKGRTPFVSSFV